PAPPIRRRWGRRRHVQRSVGPARRPRGLADAGARRRVLRAHGHRGLDFPGSVSGGRDSGGRAFTIRLVGDGRSRRPPAVASDCDGAVVTPLGSKAYGLTWLEETFPGTVPAFIAVPFADLLVDGEVWLASAQAAMDNVLAAGDTEQL